MLPYCTEAEDGGLNELAFRCDPNLKHMSILGTARLACPVFTRVDLKEAWRYASGQLLVKTLLYKYNGKTCWKD